jgi:hypothetical protein
LAPRDARSDPSQRLNEAATEISEARNWHYDQPGGREARWESTVAEQKRSNPHLANKSKAEFVALRNARDKKLPMPKLILHALQVNIAGGRLPDPEANGTRYLKFPLNALAGAAMG